MVPQLPSELLLRIVRTARYLERCESLHDRKTWHAVRCCTGNGDVPAVPEDWTANVWLLQLVKALCNPAVKAVHLQTLTAR